MGHIVRQSILAKELLRRGHTVEFLTLANSVGMRRLQSTFPNLGIIGVKLGDMPQYLRTSPASMCILDVEHGPSRRELNSAKWDGRKVVVVGGVGFRIHNQRAIDELVDLQIHQSIAINDLSIPNARSNN